MVNSPKNKTSYCCPFRPVAETSRMMHYTQLILLLLAGVAIGYFRRELPMAVCIVPFAAVIILEKFIAYCRSGGHRGSTAHSLILAMIVCFILPAGIYWLILLFTALFAILYKHILGGLGGYFLHPALAAIAILELTCKDTVSKAFSNLEHISGTIMTMNSIELAKLTVLDGKMNIEDMFVNKLPTVVDCLLGRNTPAVAAAPLFFAMLGIYCIYRGYLNWRVPIVFIFAVILAVVLLPIKCADGYFAIFACGLSPDVIVTYVFYHLVTGYVIFTATVLFLDTTSRPLTVRGQVWMAFIAGTVAMVFRLYLPVYFAEVYAVLLAGLVVPVIDMVSRPPKRFP